MPRLSALIPSFLFLFLLIPPLPVRALDFPSRIIRASSPSPRQDTSCPTVLTQTPAQPRSRPSARTISPRIIGGLSATSFTRSYLVSFSDPSNSFKCSGSLLSARWVLTAAHCGIRTTWSARVGPRRATSGPTIPIARVIPHEWYDEHRMDTPGDLAVIELAVDAPLSSNFVAININDSVPIPGAFARASGYGKTFRAGHDEIDPAPNQVDGPVNNPEKCSKIYRGYLDVKERFFICVGYGKGRCQADACHGDSGGPLVQFDEENRPIQLGIVSFGLECGSEGIPGVYVRIAPFVTWLQNKGVVFNTSTAAVASFAEGSEYAANDEVSVTVLQVIENQLNQEGDGNDLKISKVTFAVICIIAGIALIGLIFVSLFFMSARGRSRREEEALRNLSTQSSQGDGLALPPPSGDTNRDNLHLAISLLQSISNGPGQGRTSQPVTEGQRELDNAGRSRRTGDDIEAAAER